MKKITAILLAALGVCAFAACGETPTDETVHVTFVQADGTTAVKTVKKGQALTDIPTPAGKTGYTAVWERTEFAYLTEDITVNAVLTANDYTITYDAGRADASVEQDAQTVTYDAAVTLLTPVCTDQNQRFLGWDIQSTDERERLTAFEAYDIAGDVTLIALWEKEFSSGEF